MTVIRHILYEEIEDCNIYDFYLMKLHCVCEKEFKYIGVKKGNKEIIKRFKQVIPVASNGIHQKQNVIMYTEE